MKNLNRIRKINFRKEELVLCTIGIVVQIDLSQIDRTYDNVVNGKYATIEKKY